MNVLFLTPQLPYPPRQGAAIRNFNLIKNLAADHRISLLSFGEEDEIAPAVAGLSPYCRHIDTAPRPQRSVWRRLALLAGTPRPDLADRLGSPLFEGKLQAWLQAEHFDLVQVEGLELAPYLESAWLWRGSAKRPLFVFDEHNAEYLLQRRAFESDLAKPRRWPGAAYSLVQWRRLRVFERWAGELASRVVAVSEADRKALLDLDPALDVAVVPNGVDGEYFSPAATGFSEDIELPPEGLVFTGSMDFRPNIDAVLWLCDEIWPAIKAELPSARLYLVGRGAGERVLALGNRPGVTVTGAVADVRPYLQGSALCLVPMRIGGGVRLKVLEGLAMARATVCTPMGAEGLDVRDGQHLRLAASASDFARAVIDLLRRPAERERLGQQGRQFALENYDWRVVAPRLGEIYQDLAGRAT
jgi:polysaccharide biosynthesis protein PslH